LAAKGGIEVGKLKKKKSSGHKSKKPYLLLIPAFIAIFFLQILPFIEAIYMSFLNIRGNTLKKFFTTFTAPFVGLKNYLFVITGSNGTQASSFHASINKTISFVIIANVLTLVVALIIALALNRKFKFSGIARSLLLLPFIMPGFVIETAWLTLFSRNDGLVNQIIVDYFHLVPDKIQWFAGDRAFWVVTLITVWHYFPLFALFILAGLQNIPKDYYEAADIDGAGHFRKFTNITLPLLRPVLAILIFLGIIINTYDSYKVLGTEFYSEAGWYFIMDYFRNTYFTPWLYGAGSAGTIMVMICVGVFILLWYLFFRKDFNSASEDSSITEGEKRRILIFDNIVQMFEIISSKIMKPFKRINKKLGIVEKAQRIVHSTALKINYLWLVFWPVLIFSGFKHLTSNIGHEGLWYDEAYSAAIINHSFADIINITAEDSHPPLYFMALKVFGMIFGRTESSLRLFSVIGVLALALLGAGPVKRAFDKFTSIIFSLLVIIIPMSLSIGQDARMYTWAAFFVTGTVLYGYLSARDGKKADFIMLSIFSIASAYIHYYALLAATIANALLFVYFLRSSNKKRMYKYFISAGVAVACYIPWILTLVLQISRVSKDFWIPPVDGNTIWHSLLFPFEAKFDSSYPFIIPSFIGALIFVFAGLWFTIKNKDKKGILSAFAVSVYILTLVTAVVVSILVRPILVTRYIFPVVGLFLLSVSYGITRIKYKDFSIFAVAIIFIFSLVPYNKINMNYYNGPIKELKYYMEENIKPDDIFIHYDEHTFGIFSYYYPEHEHFLYLEEGVHGYSGYKAFSHTGIAGTDVSSFIKGHDNIWVVGRAGGGSQSGIYESYNNGILSYKEDDKILQVENSGFAYTARRVYHGSGEENNPCSKGKIKISINSMLNKSGPIVVKLFNKDIPLVDEESLEIIEENVYMTKTVEAKNGIVELVLEDMPMGEYCAIAFHDENNNGKHDIDSENNKFEGYGITGYMIGIPEFKFGRFTLDYFETEILINLYYPEQYTGN